MRGAAAERGGASDVSQAAEPTQLEAGASDGAAWSCISESTCRDGYIHGYVCPMTRRAAA